MAWCTMQNLVVAYGGLGRFEEAEDLARQIMDGRVGLLGWEHPATLDVAVIVAMLASEQGRWNEALLIGERVLDGRQRTYSSEHPRTLESMVTLVKYYEKTGHPEEAKAMQVRATEAKKWVRVNKNGNVGGTYIGGTNDFSGNLDLEVDIAINQHGPDHLHTLQTRVRVAEKHHSLGQVDEAENMWLQALIHMKRVLGDTHSETLSAMERFSSFYSA